VAPECEHGDRYGARERRTENLKFILLSKSDSTGLRVYRLVQVCNAIPSDFETNGLLAGAISTSKASEGPRMLRLHRA